MNEKNSLDSTEESESISSDSKELDSNKDKPAESKGVMSYSSKGTQGVFSLFGFELTAPSGLKNPGIVYLTFIVVNLFIFLVLRSFISK